MSYEEKDWIMRQVKLVAISLGKILGKDSLKEMINFELSDSEKLSDEEIEQILLLIEVEDILKGQNLSNEKVTQTVGIGSERLAILFSDYTQLTSEEEERLIKFLEKA